MVESTQHRVSHNLKMVRNKMPMFMWRDRKLEWRIRDAWPKAHVRPTLVVMCDPLFRDYA